MSNTNVNTLVAAAFAALLAGAPLAGCATEKKSGTTMNAMSDAHACKGMNTCGGKGGCKAGDNGCKGKNSCRGHGGCATVEKHSCAGKNACKGQGGCKSSDNGCAGKNSCQGKGGCAVPIHH